MVTELKLTNYWAQKCCSAFSYDPAGVSWAVLFQKLKGKRVEENQEEKNDKRETQKTPAEFEPSCPLHALLQRWNLCTNWPRPPLSSWTDAVWHPSMLCWQGGNKTTLFPFSTMSELHSSTITAADTDLFTTTLTHVCSITSSRNTCASRSLCKSTQRIFVFCHFSLQTAGNDVSQREDN